MKFKYCLLIVCALSIFSCGTEEEKGLCDSPEGDQLIFGTYYGECIGNCTFLFKIENCEVFEDDMEWFYGEDLKFKPDALTNDEYLIAEEALNKFPNDLWNEQVDSVFGIPDAYDQGGIFIQKITNGELKSWNLDTNEEVLPTYLAEYAAVLKTIVLDLSN